MRLAAIRRSPMGFGWLSKKGIDPEVTDGWMRPALENAGVRRDLAKVMKGIHPRYTLEAAERLGDFDRPVLLVWAPEKDFFPWEHAQRLSQTFPDARVERIDDSYTFVSEDQPERLAALISEFARKPVVA
jgi:pimeloyl-ACP methyl ester carboxylesterase